MEHSGLKGAKGGGHRGGEGGRNGHTPVVVFKSSSSQTTLLDRNILHNVTAGRMAAAVYGGHCRACSCGCGRGGGGGGGAFYSASNKSSYFVDSGVAGVSRAATNDTSSEHPGMCSHKTIRFHFYKL